MTEQDNTLDPALTGLDELETPRTRSRAGDFAFCGAVGFLTVVATMFLGTTTLAQAVVILVMFFAAIAMRYFTLRDALSVQAGMNVTDDQLETLHRLRAVLNALPQPVMLLGEDSLIEMANPAAERMFGGTIYQKHISGLIRNPKALDVLRLAREEGTTQEAEITTKATPEQNLLFYVAPVGSEQIDGEARFIIMLRDRTEQKKLERMRTDFVANASHELRTPLTSMKGFIETLQRHAKDDPAAQEKFLRIMSDQAVRMLSLVEDLIGLSAIEINETNLPSETVDLCSIINSVQESLAPQVRKENGTLTFKKASPDVQGLVVGDRHELYRLMQNLCDNALKYGGTAERLPRVEVSIGRGAPPTLEDAHRTGTTAPQVAARCGVTEQSLVWVRVRDFGAGIDPNDLPRLTERFYRVSPEISRSKGGTGLGLAIVKHILQRHRGGLVIESLPGEGACFTCILPGAKQTADAMAESEPPQ